MMNGDFSLVYDYSMDMLLRDPLVPPTDDVIAQVLGKSAAAFSEMMKSITAPPCALEPSWKFYNDGKAWLCKVSFKKKTVFWMSIWPGFFKVSFYFTEKNYRGILALDLPAGLKEELKRNAPLGKFIPLVFSMKTKGQIKDLIKVIEYKKSLK